MPVKTVNRIGFSYQDWAANGIIYAGMKGADVINIAYECFFPCPSNPVVEEAVRGAMNQFGVAVVISAGNTPGRSLESISPQNMTDPKPIVVASSTHDDTPTAFTSRSRIFVDISAPGGGTAITPPSFNPDFNILSLKSQICSSGEGCDSRLVLNNRYLRSAGTSLAAAYVAGLSALIIDNHPDYNTTEVRYSMRLSADPIVAAAPEYFGKGRINAPEAIRSEIVYAEVTSPDYSMTLSQQDSYVPIIGTAAGRDFDHYQLYYGVGDSPTTWTAIGPPVYTPVDSGQLSNWFVYYLADGTYTIKLVTTSHSGVEDTYTQLAYFQRFIPVAITSDGADQTQLALLDDLLAWTDNRSGNNDIYFQDFQTCSSQQVVTSHTANQERPAVSNHWAVWEDDRLGYPMVYLFDLDTINDPGALPIPLATANRPGYQHTPTIATGTFTYWTYVVWEDTRNGNYDLYFSDTDLPYSDGPLIETPGDQKNPAAFGDYISWEDNRNGSWDIYLFDFNRGEPEIRLTTNSADQINPAIAGEIVAWQDNRNGNWDIYYCRYDSSTGSCPEVQLTNDVADQMHPSVAGDFFDGLYQIVWQDRRRGQWDTFLYDLYSNQEFRVNGYNLDQMHPVIARQLYNDQQQCPRFPISSRSRIVWQDGYDGPGGNWDIYTAYYKFQP